MNNEEPTGRKDPIPRLSELPRWALVVIGTITMMFALVLIGFVSGGLAGAAWWVLAGAAYVSLGQAALLHVRRNS